MCALSLTLAVVMTVIAVHVKRLVWQTDKVIPLMLILLCCTLYSCVLFFMFENILIPTVLTDTVCLEPVPPLWYMVLENTLVWLPSYFLGIGAMLNLNKWIYFYMRILAFIRVGRGLHEYDSMATINGTMTLEP